MSLNPQDLLGQVEQLADAVDRHFDSVYESLRSRFEDTRWIPESVRPAVQRVIPVKPAAAAPPLSYLERVQRWIDNNRAVAAAILAFAGTSTYLVWRGRRHNRRKRRARRGAHGAKVEAVVLAGPPESPLTRSLASDLEKRGFLVYIPVESATDEQIIRAEGRDDIRPLHLDLSSPSTISASLSSFTDALATVTRSHAVHLASLIVVPALDPHPNLPVAALSSNFWTSNLYVHLQRPIDLIHAFLPLLEAQASLMPAGAENKQATSVVVLSRGITAALPLPGRGTESVSHAALGAYLRVLKAETPKLAISHLQLGAINLGAYAEGRNQLVLHPRSRSTSPVDALSVLGRLGHADMAPARQLHYAVFDAVIGRTTGTAFVGRGARTYAWVGRYTPFGLLHWLNARSETVSTSQATKPHTSRDDKTTASPGYRSSGDWEELSRSGGSLASAKLG